MPVETLTSSAMTIFGRLYMYWGWFTVVAGMFLLGILLAMIYTKSVSLGAPAIIIALIPTFLDVEGSYGEMVMALVQRTFVFMLVYGLLRGMSRSTGTDLK